MGEEGGTYVSRGYIMANETDPPVAPARASNTAGISSTAITCCWFITRFIFYRLQKMFKKILLKKKDLLPHHSKSTVVYALIIIIIDRTIPCTTILVWNYQIRAPKPCDYTSLTLTMSNEQVLYEDKFVRLTTTKLTIFWYYFPLGSCCTVDLEQLDRYERATDYSFSKLKTWGMALSWIWWACDCRRHLGRSKDSMFVIWIKHQSLGKGFSVEHAEEFNTALKGCIKGNQHLL